MKASSADPPVLNVQMVAIILPMFSGRSDDLSAYSQWAWFSPIRSFPRAALAGFFATNSKSWIFRSSQIKCHTGHCLHFLNPSFSNVLIAPSTDYGTFLFRISSIRSNSILQGFVKGSAICFLVLCFLVCLLHLLWPFLHQLLILLAVDFA